MELYREALTKNRSLYMLKARFYLFYCVDKDRHKYWVGRVKN